MSPTEMIAVAGVLLLVGFVVGFKLATVLHQPILDDHERLLRLQARAMLAGRPWAASPGAPTP